MRFVVQNTSTGNSQFPKIRNHDDNGVEEQPNFAQQHPTAESALNDLKTGGRHLNMSSSTGFHHTFHATVTSPNNISVSFILLNF